ncbi:MAG: biopolymer transporter ExbD [Desulfobacterales bacterium]|nr:biopolymer transporter ExbD [Desulfobacterales bacterium]
MRFRKIKEEEPSVGITPLIDIVFLLLIFIMLTSHFQIASGVPIKLPKMGQRIYESEGHKAVLSIDRGGHIYLLGEKIELKRLKLKLKDLVEKENIVHLILEADKEVKHGRVVQVMDAAKGAGVPSIVISAQWEPEKVF